MYLDKFMAGDEEARNILIERNLRLVAHVCKKYSGTNIDNDDLISIGTIGLIKGLNSFKKDKGVRLATYASKCIDNEILMYLRNIKKIGAEVPLNEPIGKDKDDNEISLMDILENDERNIEDEIDLKIKIKQMYEKIREVLKGRERTIIELRFGLRWNKTKNPKWNCWNVRNKPFLCVSYRNKSHWKISKRNKRIEREINYCRGTAWGEYPIGYDTAVPVLMNNE